MFGMSKEPRNDRDIEKLIAKEGPEAVRKRALEGNAACQIFMSQGLLTMLEALHLKAANEGLPPGVNPRLLEEEAETFTRLAAESGHAGSQFNYGKMHFNRIESDKGYLNESDMSFIRAARHWHSKAAAQGFGPAKKMLKNIECLPE